MAAQKVALITGGARGIGAAICRHFASLGYEILVNFNYSEGPARILVDEISKMSKALLFQADVSKPEQVRALFEFCKSNFSRLDVLVNNASYSSASSWNASLQQIDWAEWQKTIEVDV